MSERVETFSSFFSSQFFLPLPSFPNCRPFLFPFFRPLFPATQRGASNHHLSNKIDNIHSLFLLYLIINLFFYCRYFLSFQTATFIVKS